MAKSLASHISSNGRSQFGAIKIGVFVSFCFNVWKALMQSLEKMNGVSFSRRRVIDDVLPLSVENDDDDYDLLLGEADLFLFNDSIPPGIENVDDDPEGDIRFLEELLINDSILSHESSDSNFEDNPSNSQPPPEPLDDNFDLEPERVRTRFLILRCMIAIFHDMIEKTMEVFMDDFFVFENSLSTCLTNLENMLKRCEDTKLTLNWEKSHFMVKEGIVLGHKISKKGIEVDKAKIKVISKLP
nr:reverse transcriptase domain-containing protein [Tanacetum cinerariifolium]